MFHVWWKLNCFLWFLWLKILLVIGDYKYSQHILGFDSFLTFIIILFTNRLNGPYRRSLTNVSAWHNNFCCPLGGMLVHHKLSPSIKFHATYLHTWVQRGIVRWIFIIRLFLTRTGKYIVPNSQIWLAKIDIESGLVFPI